jgi:Flp pilus assembly pilin Flp
MLILIIKEIARRVSRSQEGQTFVEYALLLGGVSVVLLGLFVALNDPLGDLLDDIGNAIDPDDNDDAPAGS